MRILQGISNTHKDPTWDLAIQVMDKFEQSGLKNQVTKAMSRVHKLEFKQNYLAPIRTLETSVQCELLEKVATRKMSLNEMKDESSKKKQVTALNSQFVKLTNVSCWDEAVEKFPQFANEQRLSKFLGIDVRKTVPKPFADFCRQAKRFPDSATASTLLTIHGNTCNVMITTPTQVGGSILRNIHPVFQGVYYLLMMQMMILATRSKKSTLFSG